MMIRARSASLVRIVRLVILSILAGCASQPVDEIALMPAPDVYGDGLLNQLPETNHFERIPYDGILFATDRTPATVDDPEQYYSNDRGQVVRLGLAQIQFGDRKSVV